MADKPILFLLRAGFPDPKHGPGGTYCPECTAVTGILWSVSYTHLTLPTIYSV